MRKCPPRVGQCNRPNISRQGNLLTQAAGGRAQQALWLGHPQSQNMFTIKFQAVVLTRGPLYAAHVCKSCASLPPEKQAEQMTINRLLNLPWRLSKEQISWLKNRMKDKRREVRALAKEQYEMRFPPKRLEDIEDNFDFLDEDDLIE